MTAALRTWAPLFQHKTKVYLLPIIALLDAIVETKSNYLLEEKCLTPKVIYQADVTNDVDDKYKLYYGLTESSFKERFRNHIKSFNHQPYQSRTELSKYIWTLKHRNETQTIKWKIIQAISSKVKLNFCKLCLTGKYYFVNTLGNPSWPNKRSDFVINCRHKRKLLSKFIKDRRISFFSNCLITRFSWHISRYFI